MLVGVSLNISSCLYRRFKSNTSPLTVFKYRTKVMLKSCLHNTVLRQVKLDTQIFDIVVGASLDRKIYGSYGLLGNYLDKQTS